jgi:cellulose synthase/poly-beta-1,6-N-acetylglucosamine synthase-like glycosyltransferase
MGHLHLHRTIGMIIVGLSTAAALLLVFAVVAGDSAIESAPATRVFHGAWDVFYDTQAPSSRVTLAALAIAVLMATGVAHVEKRIAQRARSSTAATTLPLAPRVVMASPASLHAGPVTITVLIPAHDEADCLAETLASLRAQSPPPARVIVVADNCTDATVAVARGAGVEVVESVGNRDKKAGALNQALRDVLPGRGHNDVVMVMDADTTLDDGFLAEAVRLFTRDRALMAVGGLFYGEEGGGMIGQFQRNEYFRYARDLTRRRGRVFVLSGTATAFRPLALETLAASRGTLLPGRHGDVYDTAALTEDNEITIALKSLGGLMVSPGKCTVVTEVMPTWATLWTQRLRWQRGALENLGSYGITPMTFRYWAQQLGLGYGVIALTAYFVLTLVMVASLDVWIWFPFWTAMGLLFVVERVVTVWHGGWRARLLAATLLPELAFAAFLNGVYLKGVLDISFGRTAQWQRSS